ncbi:glycosyltransferase family 2 protein [Zhongshania guokunii]|uniref:Glycosyltransferase family 2 protein n=1 Tax=Zhongshania guokunii TaxID=641783 RepID=A0ABV3U9R0_9GAMM
MISNNVAVIILAFNEELHLERAIRSVQQFSSCVYIVDSYSTDRTKEIAGRLGAKFVQRAFVNQAEQFNWALDNLDISADWIMRLDADEVVEPDLAKRIVSELPSLNDDIVGVNFSRKHVFMGRWIKHGGRFPLYMVRLWRRGCGRVEERWMDEHVVVRGGRIVYMQGGFADVNLKDLSYFVDKHNSYATREAIEVIIRKYELFSFREDSVDGSLSGQARVKRFVKDNIYSKIPFGLSSLGYFLFRYIVQLGFLDGRQGLIYHFLQGYWYRFLVGAKVVELEAAINDIPGKSEMIAELSRITGHNLLSGHRCL